MVASPDNVLASPLAAPLACCGGTVGSLLDDLFGLLSPVGDFFEALADDIVDWFEDEFPAALATVGRYLGNRMQDPNWWVKMTAAVGACIGTAGGGCVTAVTAFVQSEVIAAAANQVRLRVLRETIGEGREYLTRYDANAEEARRVGLSQGHGAQYWVAMADGQRHRLATDETSVRRIETMSDADRKAQGARMAAASPRVRDTVRTVIAQIETRARAQAALRAMQAALETAARERAERAQLIAGLYEEGRVAMIDAGNTYWGPKGHFYPLDAYVQARSSGTAKHAAYYEVVRPAVSAMARAEVRAAFPQVARLPGTVRRLAQAFIAGGGESDQSAGLARARVVVENAAADVEARVRGGGPAVAPKAPAVPPAAPPPAMPDAAKPPGGKVDIFRDRSGPGGIVPPAVIPPPDFDSPPPGVIVPPAPDTDPSPGMGAGGLLVALVVAFGLWRLAKGAA